MGIEWPFGGRSSSPRARKATIDRHRHHRPSLPGCMSTLFHNLFDFHSSPFTHFVYNKHNPSSLHLSHRSPNLLSASHHGVEAPRNSLELDEASISCLRNKNENLQIQMGLQIKTRQNGSKKSKASEPNIDQIASNSPSAKTPNLLARLMGLDILPQTSSPSSSSRLQPKFDACYHISGTRSLPESPRVSSSRPSDVDRHHHRLSLQITSDKKNIKIHEEKREEEKLRRKVALIDITNINNKKLEYGKQDVGFDRSKVEKSSSKRLKKMVVDEFNSKVKNQEVMICRKQKPISMSMSRLRSKSKAKARKKEAREEDEASNNLLNNLNPSTKFSVKKEPSSFVAKVPYEQACSYPKGRKQKAPAVDGGERNAGEKSAATDGGAAELKYIKRILITHGMSMNNPISSPNRFSPSNPLNPSFFHRLETPAAAVDPTRHRWNRRLLFHLVDEVLGEITKKGSSSWHVRRGLRKMKGSELAEEVREKVEELPRAKCEVLEDIDSLIDRDLGKWNMLDLTEMIVGAVEFNILDSLLRETVAVIVSVQNGVAYV